MYNIIQFLTKSLLTLYYLHYYTITLFFQMKGVTDNSGLKITLYQYQTCPFCCKVRAYLDYYGFSYDIVEVNSITRKETKWSNYRKVPFLVVEQKTAQPLVSTTNYCVCYNPNLPPLSL